MNEECEELYLSTEPIHVVPPKPEQLLALYLYSYTSQKALAHTQIQTLLLCHPEESLVKGRGLRMCPHSRRHTHILKQKSTRQQSLLCFILTQTLSTIHIFSDVNLDSEKPKSLSNSAARGHLLKARLCEIRRFRSPGSEQLDKRAVQIFISGGTWGPGFVSSSSESYRRNSNSIDKCFSTA